MIPLGDHPSHWSNYLGELIREMPLYYPSWQKVPAERKAAIVTKIGTQFDLKPHMQSQRWTDINAGIQQHLQKLYLKVAHWVIYPETGTYNVESIRQRRPENVTLADWDAQLTFWNDPRNQARAAQNRQNRSKSTVVCRQGSRSLARLQDQMMSEAENHPPTSSVTALRIPIIKKGEYDLWCMKMRQYIAITDHILWDIITNGDQATTEPASSSDRHLLSFHDAQDARSL
ncbi:ribonuclease H-like domain-containing protein [Tanacetum coccineum]